MGALAERLDALTVRATSPDGGISGSWNRTSGASLRFADGSYEDYDERELERQLAGLARLLSAGYTRGHVAAREAVAGPQGDEGTVVPDDEETLAYRSAITEVVAEGMSTHQRVYVRSVGLTRWQVIIKDRTLAGLAEDEFLGEVATALRENMFDHREKVGVLRDERMRKRYAADG